MKSKDQLLLEQAYSIILERRQIELLEEGIFQNVFAKVKDKLTKYGGEFPKKFSTVYSKLVANPNFSKIIKATAIAAPLTMMATGNISGALADLNMDDIKGLIDSLYELITSNSLTDSSLQDTLQSYDVSKDAEVFSNYDAMADVANSGAGNIQDFLDMQIGQTIEASHVNAVTDILERGLVQTSNGTESGVSGSVVVEIIETTGQETGKRDVMISVSGDVIASSQEEANKIIQDRIAELLKEKNISVADLKSTLGNTANQSGFVAKEAVEAPQKFKTKTIVKLNYKY